MAVPTPSENFLTKKAGPMPVWAWGGIGLGVAWLYAKYKANKAASSSAASSASTTSSAAEPASSASPYYVIENNIPQSSTPVNITVPGGSPTPIPPPTPVPPNPVDHPPGKPPVLQGGNPPRGPGGPIPIGTPTPKPPTPAPKPAAQRYTVQRGDTLWGIAQKFYGNGSDYSQIWNYNTNSATRKAAGLPNVQGSNPNLIYPGEVFLIPAKG